MSGVVCFSLIYWSPNSTLPSQGFVSYLLQNTHTHTDIRTLTYCKLRNPSLLQLWKRVSVAQETLRKWIVFLFSFILFHCMRKWNAFVLLFSLFFRIKTIAIMKNTTDTSYSTNFTEKFITTTNKNMNSLIPERGSKCDLVSLIFKLWLNLFQFRSELTWSMLVLARKRNKRNKLWIGYLNVKIRYNADLIISVSVCTKAILWKLLLHTACESIHDSLPFYKPLWIKYFLIH